MKHLKLITKILLISLAYCMNAELSAQTLKDVYKDAFLIGVAVNPAITSGKDKASQDIVLQHFNSITVENVMKAASKRDATQVYNAVQKATRSFNKLNEKHEGVIETLEREEIVEFFERTVKLTGFEIAEGLDITEENRKW